LRVNSLDVNRHDATSSLSPIVIGVAGGTGSGKTTLARAIMQRLGPDLCMTVSQDSYYRDLAELSFAEREKVNFDHPDSLDSVLMVQHVRTLRSGRTITQPVYDFSQHVRRPLGRLAYPKPVILVEGILVLAWPELSEIMNLSVYVDAPEKVRLDRRVRRDVAQRGRDVQGVLEQYYATVRPMHQTFVEPSATRASMIVNGEAQLSKSVDAVLAKLDSPSVFGGEGMAGLSDSWMANG
jgi:uridine kinase